MPLRALGALVLVAAACSTAPPSRSGPASARHPAAAGTTGRSTTSGSAAATPGPHRAFRVAGFAAPESALYDEFHDRYLVASSNGVAPGFVSVVDPNGVVVTPRFIEGERGAVTLGDPHGMAILDGRLYVADVAALRMFYLDSGRPAGDIELPSATFLDDVVADRATGRVYLADGALRRAADGSDVPNGNDAVYVIEKGAIRPLVRGRALGNPRALALDGGDTLFVGDAEGRVYRLGADGAFSDIVRGPWKSLSGLIAVGDRLFAADRDGDTVWQRRGDGDFVVLGSIRAPSDLGWDGKRRRLLVPSRAGNALEAWDLD